MNSSHLLTAVAASVLLASSPVARAQRIAQDAPGHSPEAFVPAAPPEAPIAEADNIQFYSSFWLNLHMTLFADARAGLPRIPGTPGLDARPPAPLANELSGEERAAWEAAVAYYRSDLARRDLLDGGNMIPIERALMNSQGTLDTSTVLTPEHRQHLLATAAIYRTHWWPQHDQAIRAWAADISARLREIGADISARQARLLETHWYTHGVTAELTYYGRAYTAEHPVLTTLAVAGPAYAGWGGAEIIFHEVSHGLTGPLEQRIRRQSAALGKTPPDDLWHVCLFYITGEVWRSALAVRGIQYTPYIYSTGLFDRAWGPLRAPIEAHLQPYVEGRASADDAYHGLISSLPN